MHLSQTRVPGIATSVRKKIDPLNVEVKKKYQRKGRLHSKKKKYIFNSHVIFFSAKKIFSIFFIFVADMAFLMSNHNNDQIFWKFSQ